MALQKSKSVVNDRFDGVVPLREQLPLRRVWNRLFKPQLDGPVVVRVGITGQVQHGLLVSIALCIGCAVKGEDVLVGDQSVAA